VIQGWEKSGGACIVDQAKRYNLTGGRFNRDVLLL